MLRRAWHAQVFLILAAFEVEVFHTGVGVGVRSVETYTFQSGSNEAEVALVGQLYTHQVGVARILGLGEAGVGVTLVFVVGAHLVYDEVVYLLVEDAGTDETDTFEIIFTTQIEVIGECRLQSRITEGNLVVAALNCDVGRQGGVLGACNGVGERSAYLEVIVYIIFHQDGGKYI